MGVEREGLAPGVEDRGDPEPAARVLRIPGKGRQGVRRRAEEQVVKPAEPKQGEPVELVGQREDDVEVLDREQLGATRFEPALLGETLTLGAVAVAAGVVDGAPVAAAVTLLEVTTESGRAAGREGAQHLVLERADRLSAGEVGSVAPEDPSEVGRGLGSCRSRRLRRGAHARSGRQEVQRLRDDPRGTLRGLHEVQVARGGPEALVPEQTLQRVEVDPGLEQVSGEGVSVMPTSA